MSNNSKIVFAFVVLAMVSLVACQRTTLESASNDKFKSETANSSLPKLNKPADTSN